MRITRAARRWALAWGVVCGAAVTVTASEPQPVIEAIALQGTAPFTVHAHALSSTPGAGDRLTTRFTWSFGDSSGRFNELIGFNAAHIYNDPGTFNLELTVTNQDGLTGTVVATVNVTPDDRPVIYVSTDGDDLLDGSTIDAAVATPARAAELLTDDSVVLFRCGDSYSVVEPFVIAHRQVRLGCWGLGTSPVLHWASGGNTTAPIIGIADSAEAIVIEDLHFDSPATPTKHIVRGVSAKGVNVTVRRCHFDDVSYAITAEGSAVQGLLTLDNSAESIGAYFVWGQGTDHTHIGNSVEDSEDEHNMRFVADRILVAHNDLRNTGKSCIWFMQGSNGYAVDNVMEHGPTSVGPLHHVPGDLRFTWAAIRNNRILSDCVQVQRGAEHVLISGNVIERSNGISIEVDGYDPAAGRTSEDVRILNNTGLNSGATGRFLNLGPDTVDVTVANNLYAAPSLETGSYRTSNVFVLDSSLGSARFRNNLWAEPAITGWGNGWQYLWTNWSNAAGYLASSQWAALPETSNEQYRSFVASDLDAQYVPTFDATVGVAEPGVFDDFLGNQRPFSGAVRVGAVESGPDDTEDPDGDAPDGDGDSDDDEQGEGNSGNDGSGDDGSGDDGSGDGGSGDGGSQPEIETIPGDINADGIVNVFDLVVLINSWGLCGGASPAEPADSTPPAYFATVPAQYVIGSGTDLTLQMLPTAPWQADVIFQVWSDVSGSIEVSLHVNNGPFVFPGDMLGNLTAGAGTIQAVVRDNDDVPLMTIRHRVEFVTESINCPSDVNGDGTVDNDDLTALLDIWLYSD